MRLHFQSGSFYRNVKKYFLICAIYLIFIKYPFHSLATGVDLIPGINVKELFSEIIYSPFFTQVFIDVLAFSIIKDIVNLIIGISNNYFVGNDCDDRKTKYVSLSSLKDNFSLLNSFNPFLYSNKTRKLLE